MTSSSADGTGDWRAFARKGAHLLVDGSEVKDPPALKHGQVVASSTGTCARFFEREPSPPLPRSLTAPLAANPGDTFSWQVLADWLEEHGDERAGAARGAPEAEAAQARRFGPLARHLRDGNLVVTWAHGFIESAVLRALGYELKPSTVWCLEQLLASDEASFLRTLHVDLASSFITPDRLALELVGLVRKTPRALERLTLGPVRSIADEAAVLHALKTLPFEASLTRFSECFIGDERIDDAEPQLLWHAGEALAVTNTMLGPWLVRPEGHALKLLKVNGHAYVAARLMHGDEIELANGVRLGVTLR
ncbi:MAG: hypothetical protein JNK82_08705 [Myxococcaceae bacterium]|nr:hypothetical protein [Myxococcaceae bacterium]